METFLRELQAYMEERVAGFVYEISSVFENPETTFTRENSYNKINLVTTNLEGLERLAEVMGYSKSETLISYLREILDKLRDQKIECNREIVNIVLLGSYFLRETFYREVDGKMPPPVYDHILGEIRNILHSKKCEATCKENIKEKNSSSSSENWDDLDAAFSELDDMWQHQADMNHRFIRLMRENPGDPDAKALMEMSCTLGNLLSEIQSRLINMSHSSIAEEMPGFDNLVEQLTARFNSEKAIEEEFMIDGTEDSMEMFDSKNLMSNGLSESDVFANNTDDISIFSVPGLLNEKDELLRKLSRTELSSPFVEGITILGDGKAYIILDNEAFIR